jgi:tetratricopeptide (TPR) repeat protein
MDNSTPDMSEKLVLYLDGELSSSEKNTLEQQLAADKTLQDELESLQSTREAVKLYGLKQKVAFIHGRMMEEMQVPVKKISSVRRAIRYSVAVAASLILIVGGYLTYNFFTLSPDKVFASNYRSYELVTVRDGGIQERSLLEEPYVLKEYAKVVSIQFDRPFTIKELFLRAMSYLELADNPKAIAEYKKVLLQTEAVNTNIFKQQAEYYLALCYIRNGDYDFAIDLLNKIQEDPNHLYNEKVSDKLIRQVKMLKWR